jgi:CBS domain-containing protein
VNSGDKPLATALEMMHNEGVSSIPVLDAQNNVIGNISHVDVRVRTDISKHIPVTDHAS